MTKRSTKKPGVLYHASQRGGLEMITPRIGKQRDENEGPRIFATPSKALATVFLVDTDDSWTRSGIMDGVPFLIVSDQARFERFDQGGYLYELPSDGFECDPEKGLREMEYTSTGPSVPIRHEYFPSALAAMQAHGVQIDFVDQATFAAIQDAPDGGEAIIKTLFANDPTMT